jgi:hypothetical protein
VESASTESPSFGERYFIGNVVYVDDLGREPINVPGGRLAKVRYAPDSRRIVA